MCQGLYKIEVRNRPKQIHKTKEKILIKTHTHTHIQSKPETRKDYVDHWRNYFSWGKIFPYDSL